MNIFSKTSAYFAAPHLAKILNANLYVMETKHNNFFGSNNQTMGIYCGKNTKNINNDELIIIGVIPLKKIIRRIERNEFKRVTLILSDTPAINEYKWWNSIVKKHDINLYVMPDLAPYCSVDYKPIYQYIEINEELKSKKKNDKLLITHSPRTESKKKLKGTDTILKTIELLKKEHDFNFKLISGLKMDAAIYEKSKSHIFIDQVISRDRYSGGLGKSGIEGMLLDCCVVTSGNKHQTEPHFKSPPITWVTKNNLYGKLKALIVNNDLRKNQIKNQNVWLNDHNTPHFFKKYLTK